MKLEKVRQYFENDLVVDHYAKAAAELGLWLSEERLLTKIFSMNDSILELGCGAGRVALGLHELGYNNILGTDYSKPMVQRARHLSKLLEYSLPFRVADATHLKFEANIFNGVIFAFNDFMQIPKATQRLRALREIYRVLRPHGWFVFTCHDRELSAHRKFWVEEKRRWEIGKQHEELDDFGDRVEDTDFGVHYMHVPKVSEISEILLEVGFRIEAHAMRSELAKEPPEVLKFSDDCRFWVVQKPAE